MKDDDAKLDEILARGTLGGPHFDEILGRVLDRVAPRLAAPRGRLFRWLTLPAVGLVATAGWLLLVQTPAAPPTPKGAAGGAAAFQVSCGVAAGTVCRSGDTLMFSVNAALVSGYVRAFAERVGDPAHERIWYFPTAEGSAPRVTPGTGTVVLPDGIRIGPEHPPGSYRITVWIGDRAVSRDEIGAAGVITTASTIDMRVMP